MKPPARAVRVGYNPDFAPFTWSENGEARGLVIERITLVFAKAGVALSLEPVTLPNLLNELTAGGIDMVAALASIPQRQKTLTQTRPIAMSGGAWFIPEQASWPSDAGLRRQHSPPWRAVTPANGPLTALVQENFPLLQLQTCSDYEAAFQSVIAGDADAAALNWQVGTLMCKRDYSRLFQEPEAPFCRLPLVMATAPGDPQALLPLLDPHFRDEWEFREFPATVGE